MRKVFFLLLVIFAMCAVQAQKSKRNVRFAYVSGQNIYTPDHQKFLIQGTNVGNWLNPEGYMFFFEGAPSYRLINRAFSELTGPEFTADFWRKFKENYITEEDIRYIKSTGMNTVRVPFHYKMFTQEDYMGLDEKQDGFEILDKVIKWSKKHGLYVILDMHDAPGGQTGDNIDDSYGYPFLFENAKNQQEFIDIWVKIAKRYAKEPAVLGYDLLNEPIAHYFKNDLEKLNSQLEPLYIRCTREIRKVDKNHIIFLGGAQWNSNFSIFKNPTFDNNIAYTCHRYWSGTKQKDIQDFLDFRSKVNLPLFMGETGENTDVWVKEFRELMEAHNIGWTFWPYKKMVMKSGMKYIEKPKNWDLIVNYVNSDRSTFEKIRNARPDPMLVKQAMTELLENMKFKNCKTDQGYIKALGMKP